jgi:chromosome segregation ATPase
MSIERKVTRFGQLLCLSAIVATAGCDNAQAERKDVEDAKRDASAKIAEGDKDVAKAKEKAAEDVRKAEEKAAKDAADAKDKLAKEEAEAKKAEADEFTPYEKSLNTTMDDIDKKVKDLKAKAAAQTGEVKKKSDAAVASLETEKANLKKEADKLRATAKADWEPPRRASTGRSRRPRNRQGYQARRRLKATHSRVAFLLALVRDRRVGRPPVPFGTPRCVPPR